MVLGSWRSETSRGLLRSAEQYLGLAARQRPLVLTTTRLLLLPARGGRGAGGWFSAQYDRRKVSATRPEQVGDTLVVHLTTGLGPFLLRAPAWQRDEVDEFAWRLPVCD